MGTWLMSPGADEWPEAAAMAAPAVDAVTLLDLQGAGAAEAAGVELYPGDCWGSMTVP